MSEKGLQGNNLVSEFIDHMTGGRAPKTEALRVLNTVLRRRDSPQRLYQWETGRRPLPRVVHEFMLHTVLKAAIQKEGGRPPGWQGRLNLAARITPPPPHRDRPGRS